MGVRQCANVLGVGHTVCKERIRLGPKYLQVLGFGEKPQDGKAQRPGHGIHGCNVRPDHRGHEVGFGQELRILAVQLQKGVDDVVRTPLSEVGIV